MTPFLLVGAGGVVGALSRYAVDRQFTGRLGTVVVNVLGSVALGFLTAISLSSTTALLAGTGFCGAFTTFSSFAVTVAEFVDDDQWRLAAGYAGVTLTAALVGVVLGRLLAGVV